MDAIPLALPYNLLAMTYHTWYDGFFTYAEGEHYSTDDREMAETVIGIGFAMIDPDPPAPPRRKE